MKIGSALEPLRDDEILILGSGYSFHNMQALFNPSQKTVQASMDFNNWLKSTILDDDKNGRLEKLQNWESAPGARTSHPREEHLLPLLMVAAAGGKDAPATLIYDTMVHGSDDPAQRSSEHAVTGYLFQ
jgi:aromatic ring-opening dioxygenase catalytic subunit (LigB family)